MKRRMFTILSALSLFMGVATAMLGARSHSMEHELELGSADISISRGEILAGILTGPGSSPHWRYSTQHPTDLIAEIRSANHCGGHGFFYISEDGRGKYVAVEAVAFPFWCACLMFLVTAGVCLLCGRSAESTRIA